jgi:MBG domain (YGX type)/YDG domain
VATANLVTVNSATLADGTNGGLASNYSIAAGGTTAANITAKNLTYSTSASNKTYDGNTTAVAMLGGLTGLVGAEMVIATSTGATFNTKDVATANLVTVNGVTLANGTNGGLASNYQIAAGGTAAANINPASLTVTANNVAKTYGQTVTLAGFTSSGLIGSETIGSVNQSSAGAAPTANVAGGPYVITASNAAGGSFSASNYAITYVNGVLTVTPATLTQTANPASFVSGTTIPALSGTVTGFMNGETLAGVTTGLLTFITTTASTAPAGSYAINGSGLTVNGGANGNYVLTQAAGNATALTVTPAITSLPGGAQDALSSTGALTGSPPASPPAGDGGGAGVGAGPLGAVSAGAGEEE